jgi:hypothetical protein
MLSLMERNTSKCPGNDAKKKHWKYLTQKLKGKCVE